MTAAPVTVTEDSRIRFDRHLARADAAGAVGLVLELLGRGVSAEDLLLGLIVPAQAVVGERWVANQWSVAQEHAATHISDQAISALAAATRTVPDGSGGVDVVCPDGEWHSLPARVVSEVLRLRGFDVSFLGAAVPTTRLLSHLHQHDPGVVAISCMLPVRLPRVYRAIEACRSVGVPVLAGGTGFGRDGVWAQALGADLYAPDASKAADLLMERWPVPMNGRAALDRLNDGEYADLVSRRSGLVRLLHDRLAAGADSVEGAREIVGENLGFLLDNLEAAIFVDDERVFTEFLDFAAGLLAAREVPPAILYSAVLTLVRPLQGLPRASHLLASSLEGLERAGHVDPRR